MPEISLTDFVDFVIKAGSPKLTKVRQLVNRPGYSPALDFWKPLREHFPEVHGGKVTLDSILERVDAKKRKRYESAIIGYKPFLRKHSAAPYFGPPSEKWTSSGLTVRVNPELGLLIGEERYVIKLYFKDEEPTRHRLDAVLELMRISLTKGSFLDIKVAVLDVANGKLITARKENPDFQHLLAGEAASFVAMWAAMGGKRNVVTKASA